MQERMYEFSEVTNKGTAYEINKELVCGWKCCARKCDTFLSSRVDVLCF